MTGHVVVEGAPGTVAEIAVRLERSGATGWRAVAVRDTADASAALLAALDGVRLVVRLELVGSERVRFVEDLHRIGAVDHRMGPTPIEALDDEQQAVLRELASGASLGEVADRLHLSRRTADRRLASVRAVLGSASTAEAVAAYSVASSV